MIEALLKAGVLGAKINGSGGGCIFAYAPERFEQVAEAIKKEGGKPYLVRIDEGVREDSKKAIDNLNSKDYSFKRINKD